MILTELEAKKLIGGLHEIARGDHGQKLQEHMNELMDALVLDAIKRYIDELSNNPEARAAMQERAIAAFAKDPQAQHVLRRALLKILSGGTTS